MEAQWSIENDAVPGPETPSSRWWGDELRFHCSSSVFVLLLLLMVLMDSISRTDG